MKANSRLHFCVVNYGELERTLIRMYIYENTKPHAFKHIKSNNHQDREDLKMLSRTEKHFYESSIHRYPTI